MPYKVSKKYERGSEMTLPEQFNDIDAAKAFINEKLQEDALLKVKTLYRLYEDFDLIEEFDSSKVDIAQTAGGASSAGRGSGFNPSPFSTTPLPQGMNKWVKSDDKKEDDEEKK